MYYTVNEVGKRLNVSIDTIRRWDKKGLIKSKRDQNNYRIFSIEDIEDLILKLNNKKNSGFYVLKNDKKTSFFGIELFAGAGGTALGFENAGLNHILLNEFDKNCCKTLRSNFSPEANIIEGDVHSIDFSLYKGKVDVVQAGFPCQAFSYAGKSLGFEDTRGTLFFEFARCIKETKPKIAIGENVRGLLTHDNGNTLKTMLSVLRELGYRVYFKVLRAQYLDVPQKRERLIIEAIRNDFDCPFIFPRERNYTVSLREALKDCPQSEGQQYPKRKKEILDMVPEGGYWRDLPLEIQKEYMRGSFYLGGGKTGMARRLAWDEPSLTLTCAPAQKQTERCHPSETRPLSVREYARIQTFPDTWNFQGTITSKYKQIGNAVPVNLGYHIGNCVIAMLQKNIYLENADVYKDQIDFDLMNKQNSFDF